MSTVDLDALDKAIAETQEIATELAQERIEHQRTIAERDETRAMLEEVRQELGGTREESDRFGIEVERLRQDYEAAHADRLARTLERDRTIDEREYLKVEVERLRAVLREVLGEFTDKGSIGAIHNVLRSRWVNVGTVDRWRAAAAGEDAEP